LQTLAEFRKSGKLPLRNFVQESAKFAVPRSKLTQVANSENLSIRHSQNTSLGTPSQPNGQLKKVISDDQVKYAFEVRKRKLISQFIKNESNSGSDFGIGSGSKFLKMLIGKNQSLGQGSQNVSFAGLKFFFIGKWVAFGWRFA
jgi:hypothetical protein